MAATQEKSLSQFPTAAQILLTTLVFGSVVDATSSSGYDSVKILVSDLAEAILGDFAYTQDLATDAKTIFGAINSIRVLSGTATPNNTDGANGQIYVKYASADYSVVALYVKLNNAWREISTGGGGGGASVSMGTTEPTAASGSDGDLYVQYDGTTYEVVAMFVKINGAWRTIATGEVIYSDFITSLSAGSTSVTISDSLITTASTIDVYTDTFGVNPTDVAISTGSVTLTFNAQSDAVSIKVRVWRGVKGTIDAEVINDTTTSEYTTWSSEKIAEELGAKSDGNAIAEEYDASETYTAGDYVMHDGKLYRCNHIGATGTWKPTWWDETSATDYTKSVNTALTTQINNIHDDTADAYSASSTYAVGDLCIAFGRLYRCTTAISTPEAWNSSHWAATTIADEIAAKANASATYTKSQVDTELGKKQNKLDGAQLTNTDLNTLRAPMTYYLAGVSSTNHAPVSDCWGIMEVVCGGGNNVVLQRITTVGSGGTGISQYERLYFSRTWTVWKTITRNIS